MNRLRDGSTEKGRKERKKEGKKGRINEVIINSNMVSRGKPANIKDEITVLQFTLEAL